VYFDEVQTKTILSNCRDLGVTLGSTVHPLCQLAHGRVLHKRKASLSEADWEKRCRDPMHFIGPISLRKRMPSSWKEDGGLTEIFEFINLYTCTLPRMPSKEGNPDPSFKDLLSQKAFLARCLSIQHQSDSYFRHPLFYEMSAVRSEKHLKFQRNVSKLWEKKKRGELDRDELLAFGATISPNRPIFSNAASTFGVVEDMVPKRPHPEYRPASNPIIRVCEAEICLRVKPAQIYLSFVGGFGRLWIGCWWDGNVFEEEMVKEWVEEVASAANYYLGDECEHLHGNSLQKTMSRL